MASLDAGTSFSAMTVADLRVYLRGHGEPVGGTRDILIARAEGVVILGKRPLADILSEDEDNRLIREHDRLKTPLGEMLPHPSSQALRHGWMSDPHLFPPVNFDVLYNYLVLSKHSTMDGQKLGAGRQLKAKNYYDCHHVHDVACHPISNEMSHAFIR
jgi:hypothetical protein